MQYYESNTTKLDIGHLGNFSKNYDQIIKPSIMTADSTIKELPTIRSHFKIDGMFDKIVR